MAGVRYSRFRSRWGYRRQIHVPVRIIKGKLLLSPPALAVLFVLLIIAKRTGRAKIGKASLAERTGYSVDTVKTALRELRTARFISSTQTLRKYKEFSTNAYTVAVAQYFTMPRCIVQRDTQDEMWSLSKFTSPEIATYTSACWLADWNHNNTFIPDDLQQITGLVTKAAYDKAMDGLESRGLIMIGVGDVTLCDPYTGLEILPIDDEMENLQNQHTTINGVIHPTVFNFEKTPEFMEKLGTVLGIEFTKSGKNYKTLCLYHIARHSRNQNSR